MLKDEICFKCIYIATGYTILRFGLNSLVSIIECKTGRSVCITDILYYK